MLGSLGRVKTPEDDGKRKERKKGSPLFSFPIVYRRLTIFNIGIPDRNLYGRETLFISDNTTISFNYKLELCPTGNGSEEVISLDDHTCDLAT